MPIFKRGLVWWMSIYANGVRVRKTTGVTEKKLAERIHAKVLTQITEGEWFNKPLGEDNTFREMIERYLNEYTISKAPSGKVRDRITSQHLLSFFDGLLVKEITPSLVVKYKSERRKKGRKPATIEREICLLKRVFNLAVKEWEWIHHNPVARVSKEKFNNQIDRWLSSDEEKRLLNAGSDWLRAIVIFALNTGMRQGEILSLKWPYVSLSRKTVTVMESKNGEKRSIPLNRSALEILTTQFKRNHLKSLYVFASKVGTRILKGNIARAFYKAMEYGKVENFRFHDLRHTFATRLAQGGIDIYKIAKLLGHKDIRMTQRYAHHCTDSLRSGVEYLDKKDTIWTQSEETEQTATC